MVLHLVSTVHQERMYVSLLSLATKCDPDSDPVYHSLFFVK